MPNVQDIQSYLNGVINRYKAAGPVDWPTAMGEISDYVRANRLDPEMVAQAAAGINPNYGWNASKVNESLAQYPARQYGVVPAVNTLGGAAIDAQQQLGRTGTQVSSLFQQGQRFLDPYLSSGTQANQQQAILSGAMGPRAQQEAYSQYQSSPGVDFALGQAEKALTRNAAALGGLGGGNIQDALVKNAIGYALQDYGNQFNRLGEIANRGFAGATQSASMGPQEAAIQSSIGQASAQIPMTSALAKAGYQYGAGGQISQNIGSVSSALANLQNQQGAGMSDLYGNQVAQLNQLYQSAASGDSQAQQQLATLLSSVNMQGASGFAGVPNTPMVGSNQLDQTGKLISAAGSMLSGVKPVGPAQTGPSSSYNTQPGYGPSYVGPYNPSLLGGL